MPNFSFAEFWLCLAYPEGLRKQIHLWILCTVALNRQPETYDVLLDSEYAKSGSLANPIRAFAYAPESRSFARLNEYGELVFERDEPFLLPREVIGCAGLFPESYREATDGVLYSNFWDGKRARVAPVRKVVLAAEVEPLDYDRVVAAVLQALQQLETPPLIEIRGELPVNENTRRLLEAYPPRISFGGN